MIETDVLVIGSGGAGLRAAIEADSKDVTAETLRARLDVIRYTFIQQYAHKGNRWGTKWAGNVEIYKPFENVIDEYYTQWKQAERITTVAEFFDILGIYQQILNLVINVIEGDLSEEKREIIYLKIEQMFKHYSDLEIVKKNPELSKITFERKKWTNNEDKFILSHSIDKSIEELRRTKKSITIRLWRLKNDESTV